MTASKTVVLAAAGAAVAMGAFAPRLVGSQVDSAISSVRGASPGWLAVALGCFALAYLASVAAWQAAFSGAGAKLTFTEAFSRMGVGSVFNTLAPARCGDLVRMGLFAERLDGPSKMWTAGGLYAAITASRVVVACCFVGSASIAGAFPRWPLGVLAGLVVVAILLRRFRLTFPGMQRLDRLVGGMLQVVRSPRLAGTLLGWAAVTCLARFAATAALLAGLGISSPLAVALLVLAALDLAGAIPLTPGNLGVTTGAVAAALASHGVSLSQAMGSGLSIQALELAVSLAAGAFGVVHLASKGHVLPKLPKAAALVGAAGAAAAAGAVVVSFV